MNRYSLVLVAAAFALSATALAVTEKTVFIKDNEVFVAQDALHPQPITHDGIPKALPVWSKSGSKIAFIRETDHKQALGQLIVVDEAGAQTASVLVRPAEKVSPEGMRFVESVQWVSSTRVGVGGSVNPSMTETVVIDLNSGQEVNDIYDDGGGPIFSADGAHFAYVGGMPHFTPETNWRPTLNIDNGVIYPPSGVHIEFLTDPQWSDQSDELAVVVADYNSKKMSLIVWRALNGISVTPLDIHPGQPVDLFWAQEHFCLSSAQYTWQLQFDGSIRVIQQSMVNPLKEARKAQNIRSGTVEAGGRDVDVWCQNCPLAVLPRRQTSNK